MWRRQHTNVVLAGAMPSQRSCHLLAVVLRRSVAFLQLHRYRSAFTACLWRVSPGRARCSGCTDPDWVRRRRIESNPVERGALCGTPMPQSHLSLGRFPLVLVVVGVPAGSTKQNISAACCDDRRDAHLPCISRMLASRLPSTALGHRGASRADVLVCSSPPCCSKVIARGRVPGSAQRILVWQAWVRCRLSTFRRSANSP